MKGLLNTFLNRKRASEPEARSRLAGQHLIFRQRLPESQTDALQFSDDLRHPFAVAGTRQISILQR
jgi:hypothetical protein